MKELIAEYDCFISVEPSKNLQLINQSHLNNIEEYDVLSARYRHKVPELEMSVEFPTLEEFRKAGFETTKSIIKTKVDDVASSKNNYVVYFNGNEAHFVPLARPILKSYICNIKEEEFKKTVRQSNYEIECHSSLEEFHSSCPGGVFKPLMAGEKIRQPFVKAEYEICNEVNINSKRSVLTCFGREKLQNLEYTDKIFPVSLKLMNETNKRTSVVVSYKDTVKSQSMEAEVLSLMIIYKMVKFSSLLDLLKLKIKFVESDVLNYLSTIALFIQGYWVIKSEAFYRMSPDNSDSDHLKNARDYVLCLFHEGIEPTAKMVQSATRVSSIEVTSILEQFATRTTSTGKMQWKFPENNSEYILPHHRRIVEKQNQIMNVKKAEVCGIFNLQSLQRSILSEIEVDEEISRSRNKRRHLSDASSNHVTPKRMRLNSTPNAHNEIADVQKSEYLEDNESNTEMPKQQECPQTDTEIIDDDIMMMVNFVKAEPQLSPQVESHGESLFEEVKQELSEITSEEKGEMVENDDKTPPCFPSTGLYKDVTVFINKQFDLLTIMPVSDLANSYHKERLSKLSDSYYAGWRDMSHEDLINRIIECLCTVLNESGATKIDNKWHTVPKQILYLPVHKSIQADEKFIKKMLEMFQTSESLTLGSVKKAFSSDFETKNIMAITLKDKLQKYCTVKKQKYFLKGTV